MSDELLDDLKPLPSPNELSKWQKRLTYGCVPLTIISTLLAWDDIESIIGSGPIAFFYGLVLYVMGDDHIAKPMRVLGLSLWIITSSCSLIILTWSMGPRDASKCIPHIMTLATVVVICYIIYSIIKWRKKTTD